MINIIGAAVGSGGPDTKAAEGPDVVAHSDYWKELANQHSTIKWIDTLYEQKQTNKLDILCEIFGKLAIAVKNQVKQKNRFCVIGGDHSAAIGTWSGASAGINGDPLGLIWIDAHEDAHTFETTPSGKVHGMPVAALLGYGSERLTQIAHAAPKILPQNLCLIGIRSFEPGEHKLLQDLQVKIYPIEVVKERGISTVLQEAREYVSRNTSGYGITLDIDGIDPKDAPGVSTPEPDGIRSEDLLKALTQIYPDPKQIGFEIMEFNPSNDINKKTEQLICQILKILATGETA